MNIPSLGVREAGVLSILFFVSGIVYFVVVGDVAVRSFKFVGFVVGFSLYMSVYFVSIRIMRSVEGKEEQATVTTEPGSGDGE